MVVRLGGINGPVWNTVEDCNSLHQMHPQVFVAHAESGLTCVLDKCFDNTKQRPSDNGK